MFSPKHRTVAAVSLGRVHLVPDSKVQLVRWGDTWVCPVEGILYPYFLPADQLPVDHLDRCEWIEDQAEVCILANLLSENFFHWFEELAKVCVLEATGFRGPYVVPRGRGAYVADGLDLFGVSRDRIWPCPDRNTIFRRAWFSTALPFADLFGQHPALLQRMREVCIAGSIGAELHASQPRLWLERGRMAGDRDRDEVNRDEISHILAEFGVHRLDIGLLPLRSQILQMQSTRLLAGPHGAALLHCMFLPPGSHLIECFSPRYINMLYHDVIALLGLHYQQLVHYHADGLVYAYKHERRVRVDPRYLRNALRVAITTGA